MSDLELINAFKNGDRSKAEDLIRAGVDVNQRDDQGWTPLNFAAGKGDLEMIKLLVEKGADVFNVGRDMRTPYQIALAAGHIEAVKYLEGAESKVPEKNMSRPGRKYCKAYFLGDMRKFPGWSESKINWDDGEDKNAEDKADQDLADDSIVYLHENFTVTQSMWQNQNIIFNQVNDEWKKFCSETLNFKVPDDTDLITTAQTNLP